MTALFFKECRQVLRSLVYYIYLVVFVLFITSQMGDLPELGELHEPQPGEEYYGYGKSTDPQDIMEGTIESLFQETWRNQYNTYPFGFIKVVTLNPAELSRVKAEVEQACGMSFDALCTLYGDYWQSEDETTTFEEHMGLELDWHIPLRADYTYEEFEEQMRRVTGVIGKGCTYDGNYRSEGVKRFTYEDARQEYEDICQRDRITGAGMRLFCDYAGIFLAVLPVFVGVSVCMRDRRAKAAEVICSKRISGTALILIRYAACVALMFLPVVVCAFLMQMPCAYKAAELGVSADHLAFLTYTVVWLLPLILTATAVAFLLTELTDSIIAVLVQAVWMYGGLMMARTLTGDFGFQLIPRWNEFGGYGRFSQELPQLLVNRGCYTALSVILIIFTIIVYDKKRKSGVTVRGKIRKTRG